MKEFYKFSCKAEEVDSAELLIFAAIGDFEEMGDVSAKAFARDLAKLPVSIKNLDIHINSPGGSVFEASAIYSRLADHKSKKTVYVDGLAASAASIVAMVGHKIYIRANANMMVHLPSGIALGNADDMRQMASALDTVAESMINVYQKRTGLDRDSIKNFMKNETWFSPQTAVENGFADEIRGVVKAAAHFDLTPFNYKHPPEQITMNAQAPEPKPAPTPTPTPDPKPAPEPTPNPTPPEPKPKPANEPPTDVAAAVERGITAERERVTRLQELDRPCTHAVIQAAIKDGKQVSDVIADVMKAMEAENKQRDRRIDARSLENIPGSDGGMTQPQEDFGAEIAKQVTAKLNQRRKPALLNSRN